MSIQKIRKGDSVIVVAGRDKGTVGNVLRVDLAKNRAYVTQVNMQKKHLRGNPNKNKEGGIIDKEGPIHLSNIALYNSANQKADKVGVKTLKDGRRVRYFKSNNELVDQV